LEARNARSRPLPARPRRVGAHDGLAYGYSVALTGSALELLLARGAHEVAGTDRIDER
jgi:hypothetical protein